VDWVIGVIDLGISGFVEWVKHLVNGELFEPLAI